MSNGEGVEVSEFAPSDAASWFVENDSDREPEPALISLWQRWCNNARNTAEYAEIVRMRRELVILVAPPRVDCKEMVKDAAMDCAPGPGS